MKGLLLALLGVSFTSTLSALIRIDRTEFPISINATKLKDRTIPSGLLMVGENHKLALGINDYNLFIVSKTENPNEIHLKIYPNPAKDNITINSDALITNISICFSNGQVVKSLNQKANQIVLDISELVSGIYIIKITTINGSVTRSMIKK